MSQMDAVRAAIILIPLALVLWIVGGFLLRWNSLRTAGLHAPLSVLMALKFTGTYLPVIFAAAIRLNKEAGESTRLSDLQAHHLSGGRVDELVETYLFLRGRGIANAWNKAAAMDLMAKHQSPQKSALVLAHEHLPTLSRE